MGKVAHERCERRRSHCLSLNVQSFIIFQLAGGDGKFSLENNEVCLVTVTQPLDFEAKSTYPLTLTVRDLDLNITRSSTLTFVVTVIDENDRPVCDE